MNHTIYLDERIALTPSELNLVRDQDRINTMLLKKLREKHEDKCNSNGYVKRGSIELLGRSIGVAENGRFTGNVLYDCKFKCTVIYPTAGTIVKTRVLMINNMGAYVVYPENDGEEAIRILLPRDLHIGDSDYNSLHAEDRVYVRIERSRFQTNDRFIMAVGHISPTQVDDAPAPAPAPALAINPDDDESELVPPVVNGAVDSVEIEEDAE